MLINIRVPDFLFAIGLTTIIVVIITALFPNIIGFMLSIAIAILLCGWELKEERI